MKALICDPVADSCLEALKNISGLDVTVKTGMNPDELKEVVPEYNIAVVRSATKMRAEILEKAQNMKLIIRGGVGLDNIDLDRARELGIKVTNTPSASSAAVAELAIAMMFTIARNLYNSTTSMKEGKWEKKKFKGFELAGKTLGIIGIGRIGQQLAKVANAVGMKVVACDVFKVDNLPSYIDFKDKEAVLSYADFISLHVPFTGEPVIAEDELKKMKNTSFLINCARGGVVCEKSLLNALNNDEIAGAGIDVYEKEPTDNSDLVNHEKVLVASPHVGAQTKEAQGRVGDEIVSIIKDFI
ncbi:MAG: NAD(P)-dependent oxidoreductase [Candidatus Muiribacteriota bacterium]